MLFGKYSASTYQEVYERHGQYVTWAVAFSETEEDVNSKITRFVRILPNGLDGSDANANVDGQR